MARRQRLNEAQLTELFDPPTEQRELVRHYTLSETDLTAINRCRGDHNRLGYALMRCYLRYPGRAMRIGERPPTALLAFVAEQIDVLPASIDTYVAEERNRQRHAIECQEEFGLRPFGKHAVTTLTNALLPQAIENDRLVYLAELVLRSCRERRIVAPSPAALERLCADLRHHARREAHRRLTNGLSAEQRKRLDALTQRREEGGQTWLTWLRQMPEAAKPVAMLGVIERLEKVRGIGIEPGRGHLVHQARLAQLAREACRSTAQHAPDKAFLTGVTASREVGSATIDGVLCRHLVFSQPPGIELELWLEANEQSLPRRLIVVYRSLPGEPNFVAEFSDWNFTVHPPDAEFQFQPPEGAEQLQLGATQSTGTKQ